MNNKISKALLICALLTVSSISQAGMIKKFIFDDLSMWDHVTNIAVNDSLSINFANTTNFNNVLLADILGFQYNLAAGTTESYTASDFTNIGNTGVFSSVFSTNGLDVFLNYTDSASLLGYIQASRSGQTAQFVPGQDNHMLTQFKDVNGAISDAFTYKMNAPVQYTAEKIELPEPSILAIFVLGMMGLASRRFKKKA
jgi:hypothetical protein